MRSDDVRSVSNVFPYHPNTVEFHRKDGRTYEIEMVQDQEEFGYLIRKEGRVVASGKERYPTQDGAIRAGLKEVLLVG